MNVFGTQALTGNSPQKINNTFDLSKVDLNIGGKAGYDKLSFDSLFTNIKTEKVDRTPSQYNDYRAQDVKRSSKDTDSAPAADSRSDRNGSQEVNKGREQAERKTDTDNTTQDYRSEDRKDKTAYNDTSATSEKRDNNSAVRENGNSVQQDDMSAEDSQVNTVKIETLLSELANSNISGQSGNADETSSIEGAAVKVNEEVPADSPKITDPLTHLYQVNADQSLKNVNAGGETTEGAVQGAQSSTGLKSGDILAAILNGDAEETKASQQTSSHNSDGAKAAGNENVKAEGAFKMSEVTGSIQEPTPADSDEAEIKMPIKPSHAEARTTETEGDDLLNGIQNNNGAEKKAEIRQEHIKDVKMQEYMDAKNLQQSSSDVKMPVNKINPGMVENLIRESGMKGGINDAPKAGHGNMDSSSVEMLSSGEVRSEGGKVNSPLNPVTVSKPSGFSDVINKVMYVAKGEKTLGVTIEHKDLGQINIKLSLDKGMVNVHINTADKVAREFVESNMQQIVETLSKNGVSVGGFSVGLKNHQNSEGYGNAHSGKSERVISVDGMHEKEYAKAATNVYAGRGRVSILA